MTKGKIKILLHLPLVIVCDVYLVNSDDDSEFECMCLLPCVDTHQVHIQNGRLPCGEFFFESIKERRNLENEPDWDAGIGRMRKRKECMKRRKVKKINLFRNGTEELQDDWKIKMEGQRKGNEFGVQKKKKNYPKRKIGI